jgi:plastocyanin
MNEELVTPPKKSPTLLIVAAIALVAAVGFLLLPKPQQNKQTAQVAPSAMAEASSSPEVAGTNDTQAQPSGEARVIQLEAGSFYYKPNQIRVKVGEKVKIVMTSKDMLHDFNIDELGVSLPKTRSGQTNSIEFTATKAGSFEYYCSVSDHRAKGQVGTLIVE